jgi:hypothetical protein
MAVSRLTAANKDASLLVCKIMKKFRQSLAPTLLLVAPLTFAEPEVVPLEMFTTEDSNLEVTLWAQTPMFNNPTNMDIDKDGRIWIAEGVNYRRPWESPS